jgi:hypothetical protein
VRAFPGYLLYNEDPGCKSTASPAYVRESGESARARWCVAAGMLRPGRQKAPPCQGKEGKGTSNYPASSTRNPRRISRVSCKQVFSAFLSVTNRYRNLLKQWPLGLNMFVLKSQLTTASF